MLVRRDILRACVVAGFVPGFVGANVRACDVPGVFTCYPGISARHHVAIGRGG